MHKILVSNIGFGQASFEALEKLKKEFQVVLNVEGKRYDEATFLNMVDDVDGIIAGTEKLSKAVLIKANRLKLISRVGVGVDNIDLSIAKEKKISVCYTPDAPSKAIPEFTLSLILSLIKNLNLIDRKMHNGEWVRPLGHMLSSFHIGIVGAGKIGSKVIKLLRAVSPESPLYFYDPFISEMEGAKKLDLHELFKICGIISLHLPLNNETKNLIDRNLLSTMNKGSYLINTSRGEIVNEEHLFEFLNQNHLAGAALDVFEQEPYQGPLSQLDNCILTSHIGSLTQEVRSLMESQVVEDIIRFFNGSSILNPLPGFNFQEDKK